MPLQSSALKAKELALSLVCQAFLQHLRDLLLLQSFHELWLKVSQSVPPAITYSHSLTHTLAQEAGRGAALDGSRG